VVVVRSTLAVAASGVAIANAGAPTGPDTNVHANALGARVVVALSRKKLAPPFNGSVVVPAVGRADLWSLPALANEVRSGERDRRGRSGPIAAAPAAAARGASRQAQRPHAEGAGDRRDPRPRRPRRRLPHRRHLLPVGGGGAPRLPTRHHR
jgi:hypothetical protein